MNRRLWYQVQWGLNWSRSRDEYFAHAPDKTGIYIHTTIHLLFIKHYTGRGGEGCLVIDLVQMHQSTCLFKSILGF